MANKQSKKAKRHVPKAVLRLPDLDQAKSAVLNTLSSATLSEDAGMLSRSSLSGTARSLGYHSAKPSSSGIAYTWNVGIWRPARSIFRSARCAALRPASDCGLLSPYLAPGIRRVKGVKKIGVRLGNWLTPEQADRLWNAPDSQSLKGKRDRALLAILLACGIRRHEAVNLDFRHVQAT